MSSHPEQTHGHVRPRPDGVKARCGGPGICSACAMEMADASPDELIRFAESHSVHMHALLVAYMRKVGHQARELTRLNQELLLLRPDADAIAAVPGLQGKKAVVLYFDSEADRDELVDLIRIAKPGMRAQNVGG